MTSPSKITSERQGFWDNISEYEIDPSWRNNPSKEYLEYREKFEQAKKQNYVGTFPISIEIEASYYCNLECPFCARETNSGERDIGHMTPGLWKKILDESREKGLKAILMDHEGESLMNPNFFQMVEEAKDAGIIDIWLHTNANLLTPKISERLIDSGITKINFSLDATTEETYDKLRVGGDFKKAVKNVKDFLDMKIKKKAFYLRSRVSFVVQEENQHEKKDFYDFWKGQKGINMITFQNIIDVSAFERPDEDCDLTEQELEEKFRDTEPFYCTQPWDCNVIDVEGNVIPCGQPVREHTKDFILGNLNNGDTIESCVNGEKMQALRTLHKKGEWYKNSMCRLCLKSIRGESYNDSLATNKINQRQVQS
jgi:radical SAM protein with 4Fe4S-binding SPASM domain